MTYRPTIGVDRHARVVNISDRRNVQRIVDVVNLSLMDAKINLDSEQRARLWESLAAHYLDSGYILTGQIRRG